MGLPAFARPFLADLQAQVERIGIVIWLACQTVAPIPIHGVRFGSVIKPAQVQVRHRYAMPMPSVAGVQMRHRQSLRGQLRRQEQDG